MEFLSFFKRINKKGIKLVLKDGLLSVKASAAIDPELLLEIKTNKQIIIAYLEKFQKENLSTELLEKYQQSGNLNKELLEKVVSYNEKRPVHIPLSFSQERLWFIDQLQGSVEYHIPFALRLSGDLDKKALTSSLQEVINRHEVLRTVIYSEDGIGYQKMLTVDDWGLSSKDLTADASLLTADIKSFVSTPFDLSTDYMFRACLYDLGDREYVLAGVFHHISSDGWSQGILLGEFMELYRSYVSGNAPNLPPLSLQYIDYALWQREHLEGAIIDKQLAYWGSQLKEVDPLQLPLDYARPSIQSAAGASFSFELNDALSLSVNTLSKKEGVTVFMTLLAAFKVLLSRYSGQEDICIGTPVANRTQKEMEGMIGFFVNTLALRSEVTESRSFQELLQSVKQTTLDAYDNQQVPFGKVVERVVKTRDTSISPLFQVLFVLQNTPNSEKTEIEGLTLSSYESQVQVTSKFDLTITVDETDKAFSVNVNYCTDLFKEETIQKMFVHYQELLTVLVASPRSVLGSLSMLKEGEKNQLLEVFNDTAVTYPKDQTVVDLIEAQVNETPEAVAAVYEGKTLTYKELDERSNQLAHYLISRGAKADDLVGICIDRSLEMIVGILGILKSGGAYVPIDPSYPQSRIDYILADSGIKVVLSSNNCSDVFSAKEQLEVILLDNDQSKINQESSEKLKRVSAPENLAYVIYTSGSTGKPKGVMNAHKGIFNRLLWTQETYGLSSEDAVLQKTTFSFDVSVWELLWPLISGAKLVFARPEGQADITYLKNLIEAEQITTIHFVPSMLSVFLTGVTFGDCSSLERVLCSGEALTLEQVRSFRGLFPSVRFDNLYGPTEAAIDVSSWSVPEDLTALTKVTIGKPVSNTSLYVLDRVQNLVPMGVVGELCIGGAQVSEGYLNQEELTRENFISNPFKTSETLYKTGDLARWLPDGNIEYIGRKDSQIKVRGYRIELGEIENTLSLLPEVTQSCVLARKDAMGSNILVAYVVTVGELDKEDLQEKIGQDLPEYMVPQLWVGLEEMPLTTNGKLDRKALPELDSSTLSSKAYIAPRTEVEEQLSEIWQELLGVEKVGVNDNFFELGGQSLLAVRLIAKIQDIGYSISIREVFSTPTIALLSTKLSLVSDSYQVPENGIAEDCKYITPAMLPLVELNQDELETIMDHVPGGGANIQDIYPLSPLQEGIYFHHLMSDSNEGDPYVLPRLVSFSSLEKRSEFIKALNFVVARHDVLRTCVLNSGLSTNVQVVLREVDLLVEELVIDANQEFQPQVEQAIASNKLWIDPSQAPMLQVKVADDVANEAYYLVLNFHHLMMDHIGLEKVQQEITLYLSGKTDLLLTPVLYRDFIGDTLNKDKIQESETYFSELYGEVEAPTYPFNLSDNHVDGATRIFTSKVMLSPKLRDTLRKVSSDLHISPAVLFHAAFGLVIGRCSDTDYALFGSALLGRLQGSKGSDSSLGLFMNTLPVLLDLKGGVLSYVNHVNERLQELMSHEQTSLSNVHDWSGISNDVPLFSALLNYRHSTLSSSDDALDLGVKYLSGGSRNNFPFNFDVDDYGDDFGLNAKISATGIDPVAVVSYMKEALTLLLDHLNKGSQATIADLSILPKSEIHQLLEVFNDTSNGLNSREKTVVELLEEQVNKSPESIALVFEGEELTYQQLDERSNQLAHHLISRKVKPDTLVGISLDRSLEMLVGIWGILKSGGAYVPIDPAYPQERKDYMLEDSGVKILLSDKNNAPNFTCKEDLEVVDLTSDNINQESTESLKTVSTPENLAYVIYTSGSTGKPKGVLIVHKSLTDYFYGLVEKTNVSDCDSFGITSSIATDLGNTVLYASLLTGGTLHILTEDEIVNAEKMASLDIDCLKMVPSHWKTLQTKEAVFVPNKCLILGGEAFTDDVLEILVSNKVACEVYNHYGPTETTIGKLINKVSLTEDLDHSVPLGVTFGNNNVYVLDSDNNLSPIGVAGELCISGTGLAVGYLNQEELTKEKFISNPFKTGERLYKTGDLARWLPEGKIEFIGRKDNQIKIRGYRIELGEIENVLASIEGINHSCVLARADEHGDNRLIGYAVIDGEFNKENLQTQLLESLPEYMVPSLWVKLDEMPLTNNGKIDRNNLPDPESSELSTKAYVAPRTASEEQLVEIWQDLLKVEQVGVYDNFFELGGQSLLAIRLIARIQKIGYTVNIRDFYAEPNIALLSTKLSLVEDSYQVPANGIIAGAEQITPSMVTLVDLNQEELDKIVDHVPNGAVNIQDIYPLSPLQEGIYFHHLMSDETKGDPYVISSLLSFSSEAERSSFIEGLEFVIGRHDVFRTGILNTGLSKPIQVVLREVDLSVEELEIDNKQEVLPQVQQEQSPNRLSIDLAKAPMLHVKTANDVANEAYYLVLNHHHLMIDHIGMEKVREEISFYLLGRSGMLPKPTLYRDYIGNTLNPEKIKASETYFSDLYGGVEMPTYPFNLSNTKVDGGTAIVSSSKMLSAALSSVIRQVSTDLQVSPAVLFHAAFGILVGKCSSTNYAIFGSVLLGRLQGAKGSDSSLGLFMNTLPIILDLKGNVSAYLSHTNDRLQDLLSYEDTPLSNAHKESGIPNDAPMFSALLNYRHSTQVSSDDEANDLGVKLLSGEQRTNFPFNFEIDDYGDDFKFSAKISDVGIEPSTVVSYMEEALKGLLENIDKESSLEQVSHLSILPEEETHQLLNVFNDTAVTYPEDKTIVDLINEQVEKTPEQVALSFEGKELTYKELNERSNQLAHCLVKEGVMPDDLIGICIDRSLEMLVGILGILKSGGAYVPIDPAFPQSRIDYMLEDSGVKIVLSSDDCVAKISSKTDLEVVLLDSEWSEKIGNHSVKNLKRVSTPENLAYVIYTSGSTGKPKGVMNAHKGVVNRLLWTQETYGLSPEDVVLQKTTFSFDVSVWELLWPLISGAKLVFAHPGSQGDVSYLKGIIEAEQVTTIHFVPSMLGVFLEGMSVGDCLSLRSVLCSGEALTIEQVRLFRTLFPSIRFDNLYGPTEAAIDVSSWSVPQDVHSLTKVPIGKPVSNTSLYVLDIDEKLVPIGVVGELCIGGAQVSKGYLNQKELTREKFVSNPFKPDELLYKTGDLVCWLSDGNIEYIGRKDSQVKVRGYRIELGEIEHIISLLPEVKQCSVLAIADGYGGNRLVSYVVLEGELDKETLQQKIGQDLPEYMIPQLWVPMDEMPLTASGKLDRKALPVPDSSVLFSKEYIAPRTETEEQLVEIWQELLGIEKVGVDDNFFELGGQSLLAVRLISKIQEIGYAINIRDVFSTPTIALLSTKLSLVSDGYQVPANGVIEGSDYITPSMLPLVDLNQEELELIMDHVPGGGINIQDIYPLSPLQEGLYFHHLMSDPIKGDPYVMPSLMSFSSLKKRSEFIEGLNFVIARHDVLRTCVLNSGLSKSVQVVLRKVDLLIEELSIDNNQEILPQVEQTVASEGLWIDPSQAPMLQVKVADDVVNETYYLILNRHHLMMDHVGLEKVHQEVMFYLLGKTDLLPTPVLYRDFIGDTLRKDKLEDSKDYFSALYGNVEVPTYPFNLSNTKGDGSTDISYSQTTVSPELSKALREVSTELKISPAVLFHAAFGLLVGKCSNTDYALFGSALLGRLQGSKGSESSLGLFMNTLPVLLDFKGDLSSYINHANERLQELLSYEQTPLSRIQGWSGISNDVPLFSAFLNYRHSGVSSNEKEESIPDLGIKVVAGQERTNYPFTVSVDDYGVDFKITTKVSGSIIEPSQVTVYMQEILGNMVAGLKSEEVVPVSEVNILSKEEEHQLLEVFNDTEIAYPEDVTLVDLFEDQSYKFPDATALVYEGVTLSYQELEERSNQLAYYLSNKGVGPDVLIGICLDRSLEMIVGILGILKSGGAYVPIDPEYPQERIDYILDDAGVKVVLSTNDHVARISDTEHIDVVLLDNDWANEISKQSVKQLKRVSAPHNLAYVIYTSGSTGKPKGVEVAHANIVNFITSQISTFKIDSNDAVLQLANFVFDASVEQIFIALLGGGKLVLIDRKKVVETSEVLELMTQEKVTHLHATPSLLGTFPVDKKIGSLKRIVSGGEVCSQDLMFNLSQYYTFYNKYGPTEATVTATMSAYNLTNNKNGVTIGTPIRNTQVYIVNTTMNLVPIGVIGELCIGGKGVAKGYLNKDELTNEKFLDNPFKKGDRLYKTGDLACWLPDGSIQFIGRKDDQVKIRGYRIELGEIESALESISEVNKCCVLAKEDVLGIRNLVAYVQKEGGLNKISLQEQLQKILPEYMVPQLWVQIDEMPLTVSGKLDRKALPSLDSSVLSTKEYVAPRTEIETQLVEIWQDLLGIEKVGIYDNFFELGGHSLLAVRLISTIRKELNIEVAIRDIFELNCVEQLGNYIQCLSLKDGEENDEILFEQTI